MPDITKYVESLKVIHYHNHNVVVWRHIFSREKKHEKIRFIQTPCTRIWSNNLMSLVLLLLQIRILNLTETSINSLLDTFFLYQFDLIRVKKNYTNCFDLIKFSMISEFFLNHMKRIEKNFAYVL